MLFAVRTSVWLATAYALLYSLQYYLALIYQLEVPPASTVRLHDLHNPRNRSSFLVLQLGERPDHPLGVLLLVAGGMTDRSRPDYSAVRDSVGKQFEAYVLEPASKLYQPTTASLAVQASELAHVIYQLQRRSKSERFVLVAMDSASESVLRLLSQAQQPMLNAIASVLFINAGSNWFKEHHYEDLMFKYQTRRLLEQSTNSMGHISFVSLVTKRCYRTNSSNDLYALESAYLPNLVSLPTMEVWNLYSQFQSAHALLTHLHFCDVLQKFVRYNLQRYRSPKELDYLLRYGEQLNRHSESEDKRWERDTMFRFKCSTPLPAVFHGEEQTKISNEACLLVKITISVNPSDSLIVRSYHPIQLVTTDLESLVPYYTNGSFWLYFIEKTSQLKEFYVINEYKGEVALSLTQILQYSEGHVKSNSSVLHLSRIIQLPNIPLRVCTSNQLDLPYVEAQGCIETEGGTLFRWHGVELDFHLNNREVYGRLYSKYQHLHLSLLFANLLAIMVLQLRFLTIIPLNVAMIVVQVNDFSSAVSITFYVLFVFSLCVLVTNLIERAVQLRKKVEVKPIWEAFVYVLPLILGICNLVKFQFYAGSEWVALITAYLLAVGCRGQFVGWYMFYLSWDFVVMGQLNYHFCVLLLWLYVIIFLNQSTPGELEMYEKDNVWRLTAVYFFLLLFYSMDKLYITHLLTELYAMQMLMLACWFTWKREHMLRIINQELLHS